MTVEGWGILDGTGGGACDAEILADSPYAYWRLGESSGTTAADSSGNGRNATYAGSPTLGVTGPKCYTAASFNGSSQRVNAGFEPAGWSALSVELWVKYPTAPTFGGGNWRFAANSHNDNNAPYGGFQLFVDAQTANPPRISFQPGNGTTPAVAWVGPSGSWTGADWGPNLWHQVVGTYDGTTVRLYRNGTVLAGTNTASLTGTIGTMSTNIGLCYNPTYNGDYYPGAMGLVAVYNTALSAARVAAHYATVAASIESWD